MRTEDGHIIHQCLYGSPEAFGLLVDKYKESVYALAYAKLRHFQDAEDITQEVFIKAFQNLRMLKRWDSFLAWIYSITSNLCKDLLRSRSSRPDSEYTEDLEPKALEHPSTDAYQKEQWRKHLHDALAELPEIYRQVLTLYYLGGMSTNEISQFLRVSRDAIRQRLSRARLQLKEEMITMMETTFEHHKLQPGFTFTVVEIIKQANIHPHSRMKPLPLGFSVAAGLAVVLIGLSGRVSPLYSVGEWVASTLPSQTRVPEVEVSPVQVVGIVKSIVPSDGGGNEDFRKKPKLDNRLLAGANADDGKEWRKRADMFTARDSLSAEYVNGKIYAIGGDAGDPSWLRTLEEYNPESDTWKTGAEMPTRRESFATGVVNGVIYAIGGTGGGSGTSARYTLRIVEAYDPKTGIWTRKTDMPTERTSFSASVVNNRIYAIGGTEGNSYGNLTKAVPASKDAPPQFNHKFGSRPLSARALEYLIQAGEMVYLEIDDSLSVVEEYDPESDTWTKKAEMPTPRYDCSASVVNGVIYVMGGISGKFVLSTVEAYDPVTGMWEKKADLLTPRAGFSSVVVNGKIYVIGGYDIGEIDREMLAGVDREELVGVDIEGLVGTETARVIGVVEEYDPVTDTWTKKTNMATPRSRAASCVVDGEIYVIGGGIAEGLAVRNVPTVEVYAP